ncbi:MAG: FUSC family protein [Cyanobium sp.]
MAVLSVSVGTYGNTLELGRQRLIGTAVGAVVVAVGYRGWGNLPVVVALPLALLLARLIAGCLRLSVGYSVCCFMVVMGWLSHEQDLFGWIQLRLV